MGERNEIQPGSYYYKLIQPLAGDKPCGENLEYDTAFIMLQTKLQPRQDAEYGNFVEAAEPINWAEIERDCLSLLEKSKDIRLFVTLIRCRIRRVGIVAVAEGLQAIAELLLRYPDDLYPQLLDEGEFDPIMRANALIELEDTQGLLMDLRNQPLPKAVGLQIAVKDFEKAHASPREEGALQESTINALRQEWQERADENIAALGKAFSELEVIRSTLEKTLGDDTPDFARLSHLLQLFHSSTTPETPTTDDGVASEGSDGPNEYSAASPLSADEQTAGRDSAAVSAPRAAARGIENRSDALVKLREVRSWFTRMEPSSPVILLLEFAESTVGKSFPELLKIVPAEIIEKMNNQTEME